MLFRGLFSGGGWGQLCVDMIKAGRYCGRAATPQQKGLREAAIALQNHCPQFINATDAWYNSPGHNAVRGSNDQLIRMVREAVTGSSTQRLSEENPPATFTAKLEAFVRNAQCRDIQRGRIDKCLNETHLERVCDESEIRAAKVLRLKMTSIGRLLEAMADLSVVHYIRDPRSIAHSKISLHACRPKDDCLLKHTLRICREISRDLVARRDLEKRYPGVFLQVKYEDLVVNSEQTVHAMFNHIGRKPHKDALTWLESATHWNRSNTDKVPHSVLRSNGATHVDAWRKGYSTSTLRAISQDSVCRGLLDELGYPLT